MPCAIEFSNRRLKGRSIYLLDHYAHHTIQVNSSQSRKSARHEVQNWQSQLVTENWL